MLAITIKFNRNVKIMVGGIDKTGLYRPADTEITS